MESNPHQRVKLQLAVIAVSAIVVMGAVAAAVLGQEADSACGRRPDEYRTNHHLDHGPGSYGDVVCQPHDESGAAKRIRIKASEPPCGRAMVLPSRRVMSVTVTFVSFE